MNELAELLREAAAELRKLGDMWDYDRNGSPFVYAYRLDVAAASLEGGKNEQRTNTTAA